MAKKVMADKGLKQGIRRRKRKVGQVAMSDLERAVLFLLVFMVVVAVMFGMGWLIWETVKIVKNV